MYDEAAEEVNMNLNHLDSILVFKLREVTNTVQHRYVHVKIFFSKIELLPAADESIHCFTSFGQTLFII